MTPNRSKVITISFTKSIGQQAPRIVMRLNIDAERLPPGGDRSED
jgi:hypothetical protein